MNTAFKQIVLLSSPVSSFAKLRIIMTTALKHSMGALFWASVILMVVEVMLALLFLTCRQPEKRGESLGFDVRAGWDASNCQG